jgi:hypothetical protein
MTLSRVTVPVKMAGKDRKGMKIALEFPSCEFATSYFDPRSLLGTEWWYLQNSNHEEAFRLRIASSVDRKKQFCWF